MPGGKNGEVEVNNQLQINPNHEPIHVEDNLNDNNQLIANPLQVNNPLNMDGQQNANPLQQNMNGQINMNPLQANMNAQQNIQQNAQQNIQQNAQQNIQQNALRNDMAQNNDMAEVEKKKKRVGFTNLKPIPKLVSGLNKYYRSLIADNDKAGEEFKDLKNAMLKLMDKLREEDYEGNEKAYYNELWELGRANDRYLVTHKRWYGKITEKGKRRYSLSTNLSNELASIFSKSASLQNAAIDEACDERVNDKALASRVIEGIGTIQYRNLPGYNDERHKDNAASIRKNAVLAKRFLERTDESEFETGRKEAFAADNMNERIKYLDELIQYYIDLDTDKSNYSIKKMTDNLKDNVLMYKRINQFEEIFVNDEFNNEYFESLPSNVVRVVKRKVAAARPFTVLFEGMVKTWGYDLKNGYSLEAGGADIDDANEILLSELVKDNVKENADKKHLKVVKLGDMDDLEEMDSQKFLLDILADYDYIKKDDLIKRVKASNGFDEIKDEVLWYISEHTAEFFTLAGTKASMLDAFDTSYRSKAAYDARNNMSSNKPNLKFEKAASKYFVVENENETCNAEAEKVMIDYAREKFGKDNQHLIDNPKLAKGAAFVEAYNKYTIKTAESYPRVMEAVNKGINDKGIDINRIVCGILKVVRVNADGNPATPEDVKNHEWNNKYLDAFTSSILDDNKEKMYTCIKDLIEELEHAKLGKNYLDFNYILDNFVEYNRINNVSIRLDNLKGLYPDLFERFKKENPERYEKNVRLGDEISTIMGYTLVKGAFGVINTVPFGPIGDKEMTIQMYSSVMSEIEVHPERYTMVLPKEQVNTIVEQFNRENLERDYKDEKCVPEDIILTDEAKLTYLQESEEEQEIAVSVSAEVKKYISKNRFTVPTKEEINKVKEEGTEFEKAAMIIVLGALAVNAEDYKPKNTEMDFEKLANDGRALITAGLNEEELFKVQRCIRDYRNRVDDQYIEKFSGMVNTYIYESVPEIRMNKARLELRNTELGVLVRAAKKQEEKLLNLPNSKMANIIENAKKAGFKSRDERIVSFTADSEELLRAAKESVSGSIYKDSIDTANKLTENRIKDVDLEFFKADEVVNFGEDFRTEEDHKRDQIKRNSVRNDEGNRIRVENEINFENNMAFYDVRSRKKADIKKWESQKKFITNDTNIKLKRQEDPNTREVKYVPVKDMENAYNRLARTMENTLNRFANPEAINDEGLVNAISGFKDVFCEVVRSLNDIEEGWSDLKKGENSVRLEKAYNTLSSEIKRAKREAGRNASQGLTELNGMLVDGTLTSYTCQIVLEASKIDDIVFGARDKEDRERVHRVSEKLEVYKKGTDVYQMVGLDEIDKVLRKGSAEERVALAIVLCEQDVVEDISAIEGKILHKANKDNMEVGNLSHTFASFVEKLTKLPRAEAEEFIQHLVSFTRNASDEFGKAYLKNLGDKNEETATREEKKLAELKTTLSRQGQTSFACKTLGGIFGVGDPLSLANSRASKLGGETELSLIANKHMISDINTIKSRLNRVSEDVKKREINPILEDAKRRYQAAAPIMNFDNFAIVNDDAMLLEEAEELSEKDILMARQEAYEYSLKDCYGKKKRRVLGEMNHHTDEVYLRRNNILVDRNNEKVPFEEISNVVREKIDGIVGRNLTVHEDVLSGEMKLVYNDFIGYIDRVTKKMNDLFPEKLENNPSVIADLKGEWEDEMAVILLNKKAAFVNAVRNEMVNNKALSNDQINQLRAVASSFENGDMDAVFSHYLPLVQKISDMIFNMDNKTDIIEAKKTDELVNKMTGGSLAVSDEDIRVNSEMKKVDARANEIVTGNKLKDKVALAISASMKIVDIEDMDDILDAPEYDAMLDAFSFRAHYITDALKGMNGADKLDLIQECIRIENAYRKEANKEFRANLGKFYEDASKAEIKHARKSTYATLAGRKYRAIAKLNRALFENDETYKNIIKRACYQGYDRGDLL